MTRLPAMGGDPGSQDGQPVLASVTLSPALERALAAGATFELSALIQTLPERRVVGLYLRPVEAVPGASGPNEEGT